jgi:hypothetical protein
MRPIRIAGKVIGVLIVVALATLLFGLFVQMLWNNLMPEIFHFGMITFWQAVGLLILARILFFKGFGSHRWRGHGPWGCQGGKWGYWQDKWKNMTPDERDKMKDEWSHGWYSWKQKWHNMSPEEKAQMKAHWKDRCGHWESTWSGNNAGREEKKEESNPAS